MITWGAIAPAIQLRNALGLIFADIQGLTPDFGGIRLFQNDYTPSIATIRADLTEADFSGYTAGGFTGTPVTMRTDAEGNAYAVWLTNFEWEQSGVGTINTVYGYWITDVLGNAVYAAKRFPTPIVFDHVGKSIVLEIGFRVPVGGFEAGEDLTESA